MLLQKQLQVRDMGMVCVSAPLSLKHSFFKAHKNYIVAPGVGQVKSSILNKFLSLQDLYSV